MERYAPLTAFIVNVALMETTTQKAKDQLARRFVRD
jgi:hypothetical protein